jgi:hypothetical protein
LASAGTKSLLQPEFAIVRGGLKSETLSSADFRFRSKSESKKQLTINGSELGWGIVAFFIVALVSSIAAKPIVHPLISFLGIIFGIGFVAMNKMILKKK